MARKKPQNSSIPIEIQRISTLDYNKVKEELYNCYGNMTVASMNLGVTLLRLREYVRKYPELMGLLDEGRARVKDIAFHHLTNRVISNEFHAIKFLLKDMQEELDVTQSTSEEEEGGIIIDGKRLLF